MARQRPSGWWYPWIFVGCMLVVVVVNGILIYYAVNTFSGLSEPDHYRKGLAYNEAIASAKQQQEMGWRVVVEFSPDSAGHGGELSVAYRDRDGNPLPDLKVEALFVRPTHQGFDGQTPLAPVGNGLYKGRFDLPLAGQWNLRLHARGAQGDGGDFVHQISRKIQAP